MIDSMKLNKHDYTMIADILDAHYEDKVGINDDTNLEYLEELIDKVVYMIGVHSSEER